VQTVLIIACVAVSVPLFALGLFLLVNSIPPAPRARRFTDAIRGADPHAWIFVEPMAVGPNQGFRSRLPRLQDPRSGGTRLIRIVAGGNGGAR
jgi:hypothetical protein